MSAPQTWLPIAEAARVAGVTAKGLRRRIERGTVVSELRDDGHRHVLVESIRDPGRGRANGTRVPSEGLLLERLEELAAENGRLRALTAIAESTEQRLAAELHEARARVLELEHVDAELAAAGPVRAWRLARARRSR